MKRIDGLTIAGTLVAFAGSLLLFYSARNLADSDGRLARRLYDAHDAVKLLDENAVRDNIIIRENLVADAFDHLQAAKSYRPDVVELEPYIQRLENLSGINDSDLYHLASKYDPSVNQITTGISSFIAALGIALSGIGAKDTIANAYQKLKSKVFPARQSSS